MKTVFEVGDSVIVEAIEEFGICSNNERGGTISMSVGKPFLAIIEKAWHDYEIGQRYVAKTEDGRKIFFGDCDVKVEVL
jgi:hypothetical protein